MNELDKTSYCPKCSWSVCRCEPADLPEAGASAERISSVMRSNATNKWIKVSERLPEKTEWVLVYGDGAVATRAYVEGKGFVDWENTQSPGLSMYSITHWMHLPENPKD